MSEKTEKPTAKKLREARAKGQVAKSVEITSGVQLAVLLGYFTFEGEPLLESFEALLDATINAINLELASAIDQLSGLFASIVLRFVGGIAALVIVMTIVAVIAQIGPLLAPEAIKPSLEKVNPLANAKQMFSMRSLFEFAKSLTKVALLSLIFFYLIRQYAPSIQFLPLCGVACGLAVSTQLLYWMWAALIGFYVIFGIADFAFQRYNTQQQLMMSLEDIKQEFKNSEGNPEMKQKRKEVHREVQSGSLAANVAKSTAVVRNPTHIAVCLYFRPGETPLPQVIEIGHDEVALHIVALAEKAGIPVVENIGVARALAARTEVGRYIPAELFEPVAHILRIAMKLDYDNEEQ
ncbi:EscU/YscU/HrcU family type III secretion system export apparatus switch protein [Pseudomonas sp. 6D_7.1_Bac1]|uniref:EscU/YscU/HrcU family type III secretion system export apparatus switch protein n=1 Tax=Pseudomonas sp. 6D_7.1_Bac1 TaxID=2971615 RepID=UPI0021C748D7|nr:EscU/YscU/HrcU family type III secretion system export apparatus switch protein [Pseudomonas sp. 6D_7.1_Bac1]MCU1748793.1 EscU/YscU/HrcU family type III secretion system export apparatus switch protein [Pseudomonas sp. 6D_7.1_Bac1]